MRKFVGECLSISPETELSIVVYCAFNFYGDGAVAVYGAAVNVDFTIVYNFV